MIQLVKLIITFAMALLGFQANEKEKADVKLNLNQDKNIAHYNYTYSTKNDNQLKIESALSYNHKLNQ
jgi:hypothetical protein